CAIAPNGNACRITIESSSILHGPLSRRVAILWRCRKFVFGGKAIVHRNGNAVHRICYRAANSIMAFDIANDPTTTMKVDKHRKWTFPLWRVYAYRDRSLRPGYIAAFH